jgi:hypothetical protein
MKRTLLVVAALASAALTTFASGDAEARRRARVRVRGHVHIHVGTWAPAPPPPPPPVYYGPSVPQDPYYQPPQPYYEPVPVVRAPRRPTLAIGLFAAGVTMKESNLEGEAHGAMLRVRAGNSFELEGELAQQTYGGDRADLRAGGSLYWNLSQRGAFVPFLVGGIGVNVVTVNEMETGDQQMYLQAGAGLKWRLGDRFALTGDLRAEWLSDARDDGQGDYHMETTERATQLRLGALLYF